MISATLRRTVPPMTEPLGEAPPASFLASLGARGQRRAEPRASIAIAGAGCALAVLGALIVAGDTGTTNGDFNQVPGIVLSALVVAAGFFTLSAVRQGAMATAGAVAAALGVPPLMFFVTFDEGGFPPYSTEGILLVSTAVWLGSYAVGPGRGRPFFLGAGLIGFWFTVLQLTENLFEAPFVFIGGFASGFDSTGGFDDGGFGGPPFDNGFGGPTFDMPDPTTLGILSLALGVAYLVVCRWLDRQGHHGAATPFALATLPTLFGGTLFLADDLEQAGTGLLIAAIGAGLAHHGATLGRRITAWSGGGATTLGVAVFLSDMTDDATIGGMLFLAAGIGLVAAGHAIATALNEPDELVVTSVARPTVRVATPAGSAPIPPPPGAPESGDGDDHDEDSAWKPPSPPSDIPPPPQPPPF